MNFWHIAFAIQKISTEFQKRSNMRTYKLSRFTFYIMSSPSAQNDIEQNCLFKERKVIRVICSCLCNSL